MKTFRLEIRSPESKTFSGSVTQLTAQAVDGGLGILADHAPLATKLKAGYLQYYLKDGEENKFKIDGGFLIVKQNRATVLLA